jgi:hypothetical protein
MQVITPRAGRVAVLGVAAVLVAGCGSTASNPVTHALSAAQVIKLAANQASQVNTVSADISVRMSGQQTGNMQGTMTMRIRPDLAMDLKLTQMTMGSQNLPGGMHEILTGHGLYMQMPQLRQMTGKPWMLIPESTLNKATGNTFSQLAQQTQQEDPLSSAQMLGAAQNVKQIGTGTVAGVPVTRYSGVISVQAALSKLSPQLRKLAQQEFSSLAVRTVPFTAAVDQQHQIRQVDEQINGTSEQTTTSFTIIELNQAVSIQPPPASQVSQMPSSALSGLGG